MKWVHPESGSFRHVRNLISNAWKYSKAATHEHCCTQCAVSVSSADCNRKGFDGDDDDRDDDYGEGDAKGQYDGDTRHDLDGDEDDDHNPKPWTNTCFISRAALSALGATCIAVV